MESSRTRLSAIVLALLVPLGAAQAAVAQTTDLQNTDSDVADSQASDSQPSDTQTSDSQPAVDNPFDSPYEPILRDPIGTRNINAPMPWTVGRGAWESIFAHRFNLPINDGDYHNLWGLDSGAEIGLGVTYGFSRYTQFEIFRSTFQETWEPSLKFLILEQAPAVPFSFAVRIGADLPNNDGVEDDFRPFIQVPISRQLRPGMNLLLVPTYIRYTSTLKDAFNVAVGLTFRLQAHLHLELEWIPRNADAVDAVDAWHVALSRDLGGGNHIFEIILGNSQATTVDQYAGSDFALGFESDDVRLGFNIVRIFQ